MKMTQELQSTTLIYLKAVLFFCILLISFTAIVLETQDIYIVILLLLIIWSSARLYYFMFYVIEKYVDSEYKFSGIWSFLQYWLHRNEK